MQFDVKSALTVVFALLCSATQAQPNRIHAAAVSAPKAASENAHKVAQSGRPMCNSNTKPC